MPLNHELINELIQALNLEVNDIIESREDVLAVLRIEADIDDDIISSRIVSQAKLRAATAAQNLVTLFSN